MTRRHILTRSAAALAAMAGSSLHAADWTAGQALPDLSKFGLLGKLPSLKGKVVYLDFFASWCTPCKASFPVLNEWHQQLANKGLVVLAVSVDETEKDMQSFLSGAPASFPVVRDPGSKLVAAANVSTMPTSFIIDRKGVIRHVHNGFRKKDAPELLSQIQALL
jgi:thiol-disulfide isomerase/thioredoxin